MKIAEVVFPIPVDKSFSYSIPEWLEKKVQVGIRVRVPFGNRNLIGFVVKTHNSQLTTHNNRILKEIIEIVDEEPVLSEEMLKLSKWISSYYFCPLGKVLNAVVPIKNSCRLQVTGLKNSQLSTFNFQPSTVIKTRATESFFIPTEEQKRAIDFINQYIDDQKFGVALLEGPPRTGKTEVYLQCAAHTIDRGRQVLLLTPEISLTSALAKRFADRFGSEKICIFHSGLSRKAHDIEWERIKRGEVNVVTGSRSAIFSPLNNIGLIVIDGEDDATFKEEKEPRYNARDVAIKRAEYQNAFIILESPAPSLEAYHNAVSGKYQLFKFSSVFKGCSFPVIDIVDRRKIDPDNSSSFIISQPLEKAIRNTLESKGKAMLFLNRRGFCTVIICAECGGGIYCPDCQVPLVLHNHSSMLCHYCNYRVSVPDLCPHCGGVKLRQFGTGTQRVAEEVKKIFPDAKTGRLDTDIVKKKELLSRILDDFNKDKINVLVGTQMISKDNITGTSLLGIISVDSMLNFPDFRNNERTFQILTRLMGLLEYNNKIPLNPPVSKATFQFVKGEEGGLERKGGEGANVIIQTHNPDNPMFSALRKKDYSEFYKNEIRMRRALKYPPFAHLANLIIYGKNETSCMKIADSLARILKDFKEKSRFKFDTLGPSPAPLLKLRGKYRYQILIKARKSVLDRCIRVIYENRTDSLKSDERITVDIDPIRMM